MRLPVRAPHLARCDKIDVLLFSSKTPNSYDALLASIMRYGKSYRKKKSSR